MRRTLVCPECGAPINHGVQIVSNDNPPFERFHCDACGREGITEDLVLKRDFAKFSAAHPHGHVRGAGGGSLVFNPTGFPHMWRYSYAGGNGSPLSGGVAIDSGGTLDTALCAKIARWHVTTLDISPWTNSDKPIHNTAFSVMRAANPRLKILLYHLCNPCFQNLGPNPTSFDREAWLLATSPTDLRLYDLEDGGAYPTENPLSGALFDLNRAGPTTYANLWKKYGSFGDGWWLDIYIDRWSLYRINHHVNPALPAPGYADTAAMDAAATAALTAFAAQMNLDPRIKVGNSGAYSTLASHQLLSPGGELFENWPSTVQSWTFDMHMDRALAWQGTNPTGDGGIFIGGYTGGVADQTDINFAKQARFCLGCACVAGGHSYCGNSGLIADSSQDMLTWADEYTVNSSGVSDGTGTVAANRGWLGRPTALGFKHSSGCYVREFQRGIVIVNGSGGTINHPLTGTWRRIQGVFAPSVNNGATVSGTVNVPTSDARFLLRT